METIIRKESDRLIIELRPSHNPLASPVNETDATAPGLSRPLLPALQTHVLVSDMTVLAAWGWTEGKSTRGPLRSPVLASFKNRSFDRRSQPSRLFYSKLWILFMVALGHMR